jgi:hypothetical protein
VEADAVLGGCGSEAEADGSAGMETIPGAANVAFQSSPIGHADVSVVASIQPMIWDERVQ